ncbi:MAG: dTDP-4-dehydrorhamnose 3,5-epimerase [Polyangia bacterium]
MKILEVRTLAIPEIKVIRFARFCDARGYFTEHFRLSDFAQHPELGFLSGVQFQQANESYSRPGTVRGLHFQWNPYMGKLVRAQRGRLVDLALDIRKGSPTCGQIIAYDIPSRPDMDYADWIWLPPGFAHGTLFVEETQIEYFCSGQWSPGCEAAVSPLADDLDWSRCEPALRDLFRSVVDSPACLMTDKDRNGLSLKGWLADPRSEHFVFGRSC